jgi:hypothetical protein
MLTITPLSIHSHLSAQSCDLPGAPQTSRGQTSGVVGSRSMLSRPGWTVQHWPNTSPGSPDARCTRALLAARLCIRDVRQRRRVFELDRDSSPLSNVSDSDGDNTAERAREIQSLKRKRPASNADRPKARPGPGGRLLGPTRDALRSRAETDSDVAENVKLSCPLNCSASRFL